MFAAKHHPFSSVLKVSNSITFDKYRIIDQDGAIIVNINCLVTFFSVQWLVNKWIIKNSFQRLDNKLQLWCMPQTADDIKTAWWTAVVGNWILVVIIVPLPSLFQNTVICKFIKYQQGVRWEDEPANTWPTNRQPFSYIISLLTIMWYASCVIWFMWQYGPSWFTWWLLMSWCQIGTRTSATIMMAWTNWYMSTTGIRIW